jgi:hypothetical protein
MQVQIQRCWHWNKYKGVMFIWVCFR